MLDFLKGFEEKKTSKKIETKYINQNGSPARRAMSHIQANLHAMVTPIHDRSIDLKVTGVIEPRLMAATLRFAHDPAWAIEEFGRIWKYLHRIAEGLEIVEAAGRERMGPKTVLLRTVRNPTYHACDWKTVLSTWTKSPTQRDMENPYAPFSMQGVEYVLADSTQRNQAREALLVKYGVQEALSPIFLAQRFEDDRWVDLDEELALRILKFCVSQGHRRQLRHAWTETRFGNLHFRISSTRDVRTIAARMDEQMLNLRIQDTDSYDMRFLEPVHKVSSSTAECYICFGNDCNCTPTHPIHLTGCNNYIHGCCFDKVLADRRDASMRCELCRARDLDLAGFGK